MYVDLHIVSYLYLFLAEVSEILPILVKDSIQNVIAFRPMKIVLRHTERRTNLSKIIDKFRNRFAATPKIFSPNYQRLLQGHIILITSWHYSTH